MKFKSLKKSFDFENELKASPIELYGNRRVIVFDCKSIIDYSDDLITLDLGELKLSVKGERLVADSFSFGQTDISGKINEIRFYEGV